MIGVSQPVVSRLLTGRLEKISLESLVTYIVAFGLDVKIVIKKNKSDIC
jgi:predicted XRE-type DNA-binding protein